MVLRTSLFSLQALIALAIAAKFENPAGFVGSHVPLPPGGPGSLPGYMRDNIDNEYGTAPDNGLFNGPILGPISPSDQAKIHPGPANETLVPATNSQGSVTSVITLPLSTTSFTSSFSAEAMEASAAPAQRRHSVLQSSDGGYWLEGLGGKGIMPLAPSNYTFFRNVMDYGATGDGSTDDTAAINKAASDGNRCGDKCGSTTVLGAIVYFPPGTYVVSSPIIQYYYTQFIGDPDTPPTLQSTFNFTGIAIVDSDVYIPGGNGAEWYLNQNNFYRSVQNINFDMSQQARQNTQNYQVYVPTGIHWQVGQGTSITNCSFTMSVSSGPDIDERATGVGIFMENGSGGFMSDLYFYGGNAGMVVGSQQFTFRNLQFVSCLQAVSVLWNWGMTFQNVYVESCYYAFNSTVHGGSTGQGTGTLTIIDSHFNGVPTAIFIPNQDPVPNIIIDNLLAESSENIVWTTDGKSLLAGDSSGELYIESWGLGGAYINEDGARTYLTGDINPPPSKSSSLLGSDGRFYTQSKPSYSGQDIIVATDNGVSNDMTGDQTSAINSLLADSVGKVIYFPAGIYLVRGTVFVPEGSLLIGSAFSQIMATGSYFQDQENPQVMVRVGNQGDQGTVQIQDFLFTVQGPTAGCILLEWNIAQSSQGSAAMWNSNFRVGGAEGTDLQVAQCQGAAPNSSCNAASLLMHLTPGSSGYFENVWAWVADHDLDNPANAGAQESQSGVPVDVSTDVNIYAGRGILVESQGPTWFWATASEHSELYNYELTGASDIYLGCMQTESPYYQPESNITSFAYQPNVLANFTTDPTFSDCSADNCWSAWALRMLNSSNIYIYSSGFYSFFNQHQLGCGNEQTCQERLVETDFVGDLYYYGIFTYGATEIISPFENYMPPIFFNDSNQSGYTSEIAVYLELASDAASSDGINSTSSPGQDGDDGSGIVYIGPTIWSEPASSQTVACDPPCTLIFPPITLSTPTTISIPLWTTTLVVGWTATTTITTTDSQGTALVTSPYYTAIPEQTVITIPPITTTEISIWQVTIPANATTASPIYPTSSVLPPPIVLTDNPNPLSQSGVSHSSVTRTIYPPPWPWITASSSRDPDLPTLTYKSGEPEPTCHEGCGSKCRFWCTACNPILAVLSGGCSGSDFCTDDCPSGTGPGNDGTLPPNDPDSPDGEGGDDGDDDDDDCTTATASSCSQYCQGSSCTTTCVTYQGCSVTDTELATTETAAPYWVGTIDTWPTTSADSAEELSIEASVESALIASGLVYTTGPTITTVPPTISVPATASATATGTATTSSNSISSSKIPTNTPGQPSPSALCFSAAGGLVQFTKTQFNDAVMTFCDSSLAALDPNSELGVNQAINYGGLDIVLGFDWASDQTGCSSEQTYDITDCDTWYTAASCLGNSDDSYGGELVVNTPQGCVEFYIEGVAEPSQPGTATGTATATSTASSLPFPTISLPYNETTDQAYCFSPSDDDGDYDYQKIYWPDAVNGSFEFCAPMTNVLKAESSTAVSLFEDLDDYDNILLTLAGSWAVDQTGCSAKQDYDFPACDVWFDLVSCIPGNQGTALQDDVYSYGGALVLNSSQGCVLYEMFAGVGAGDLKIIANVTVHSNISSKHEIG